MTDFRQLPIVTQDPTDRAFVQDPYPFYAGVRSMGDVVFWSDYNLPVATTFGAVTQILKHPSMGRAPFGGAPTNPRDGLQMFDSLEKHSLLEIEPPDHTRIRREAMKAFTGPQIAMIAPEISRLADRLISDFPDEPFDLLEAYAKPLAALSITTFLGVAQDQASTLQDWSNRMVAMYQARRDADIEAKAEAASQAFVTFIKAEIEDRRIAPGKDFLSQLVGVHDNGGLSTDELVSTAILLLNAGHEATAHSIGNAVPLLTGFEARSDALSPDGIAGTVEECLRFRPPLHLFKRQVYETATIGDVTFEAGDEIACLLASANRDDAVWPDGEVFDPFRPRLRHTAFGVGLHACLGAALARLELQIALPVLFARCPNLQIEELPRVANLYHFHGYEKLMVSVR